MNKKRTAYIGRTEKSHQASKNTITSNFMKILLGIMMVTSLIPSLVIYANEDNPIEEILLAIDDGATDADTPDAQEPPDGLDATDPDAPDAAALDDPEAVGVTAPDGIDPDGAAQDATEPDGTEPTGEEEATEATEPAEEADSPLISSALPPVIVPLDGDLFNVTFISNGLTFTVNEVADGDYCDDPGVPYKLNEFGAPTGYWPLSAVSFRGWSTVQNLPEGGDTFNFASTVITSNLTLYAQFSDTYLVNYKNAFGQVVDSKRFLPTEYVINTSVNIDPPADNMRLAYWYVEEDYIVSPTPPIQFSFGHLATRDMTLVPWFSNDYYVFYISDGSQVPYTTTVGGTPATRPSPDPERLGYSFLHWSTTPGGAAFDFNTPITADIFLYAVWEATPDGSSYTLVYWVEKPDFSGDPGTDSDNYIYYKQEVVTATVEDVIAISSGDDLDKISVDLNRNEGGSQVTYTVEWATFDHGDTKTVLGNGTTVVNVYFKRVLFDYVFDINAARSGTDFESTLQFKDPDTGVAYGTTYTQTGSVGARYSFSAKFEQSVEAVWPSSWNANINSANTQLPNFVYWNVDNTNATSAFVSKRFTVTTDMIPVTGSTVTMRAAWGMTSEREANYWLERLPGETGGEQKTFNGVTRWFVKSDMHSQKIWLEGILSPKTIEGTTWVGTESYDINGNLLNESSPGSAYYQFNFYYSRSLHTLSFNTLGGSYIAPRTGIMFGTDLSYNGSYIPTTPPTRTVDGIGYSFRGWYLDADYQEPLAEHMPMPNYDLMLFARWESTELTVRFYDDMTMDLPIPGSDVGKGYNEYLQESETPYHMDQVVEGRGMFNGWYVYIGSTIYTMRFSYDTPIVDDLELHAAWKVDGFRVTYDLNGGTGTAPVDNNVYWLGRQARVASGDTVIAPEDMIFIGWDEVNTGKFYYPGMIATLSGNADFQARYGISGDYIPLVYHSNYPLGVEETITWNVEKNSDVILAGASLFSYTDNNIIGWSLSGGLNNPVDYALEGVLSVETSRIDLYAVWSFGGWTVTFDEGDHGSFASGVDSVFTAIPMGTVWGTYFDGSTHAIPVPVADSGYRFTGWLPTLPAASSVIDGNLSFTAQYSWIYTLSYNGNGATSGSMPDEEHIAGETFNLAANAFLRTGQIFNGWATSATGPVVYADQASFTMPASDTTLYAVWNQVPGLDDFTKSAGGQTYIPNEPNQTLTYTISFQVPNDVSGYAKLRVADVYTASQLAFINATLQIGSGSAQAITADSVAGGEINFIFYPDILVNMAGQTVTLTLTFSVSANASGTITNTARYYITPRGNDDPGDPDGEDTEEVEARDCYVVYSANASGQPTTGAVPIDPDSPYVSGSVVTVQANPNNLARAGYIFLGWSRNSGDQTPQFAVDGSTVNPSNFTITTSTTLYAIWKQVADTGEFAKTSLQSGYVASQANNSIVYRITYRLPDAAGLATWSKLRITDSYPISQLTLSSSRLSYDGGASTSITPDSGYAAGLASFSFPISVLDGHAGQLLTLTLTFDVAAGTSGTISNTARYYITPIDGEEPGDPNNEDDEDVYEIFPIVDFSKTGNNFSGVGATVNFNVSFRMPNDLRGYSGLLVIDRLPNTLTYGSASVRVNNANASGPSVSFANGLVRLYFSKANLAGLEGANIELLITVTVNSNWTGGDITNYVEAYYQRDRDRIPDPNSDDPDAETSVVIVYQPTLYTVTYNAYGGFNPPTDDLSPYNAGSLVTVLGPGGMYRPDYTFLGWTDTAGTGVVYGPGSTFTINSNVTLFAVWNPNYVPPEPPTPPTPTTYTVTYAPGQYGTFAPQVTSGLALGAATPAAPTPTGLPGWTFTGWTPTPTATVQGNATYTAQWDATIYTVTFVDYDRTVLKTERVAYGGSATAPPNPVREGYEFDRWDRDFSYITQDLTVTAQYRELIDITQDPPPESPGTWALLNLILCIGGFVLALFVGIRTLLPKRKDETMEGVEPGYADQTRPMPAVGPTEQTTTEQTRRQMIWIIATIVLGILGVVVFMLTEDMRNEMILMDIWTIVNAIILILEIVTTWFSFRRVTSTDEDETPQGATV